ncbi:R3H and coiled-coil domain-containing protein 1 [Bombina bombina]|uniref:R3H and coiled-coil domain-containing protein 1 n=1 Tax=Bombina bombina TaxID=8345 RepID=UPI00235AC639|nr:R3H and coiled-coil domain-containing protein 1 [Bombina bombina]
MELDHFLQQGDLKTVLLFPPVSSRLRYLIHHLTESHSGLSSFSVGEGWQRRTVICHADIRLPDQEGNSRNSTQEQHPGRRWCGSSQFYNRGGRGRPGGRQWKYGRPDRALYVVRGKYGRRCEVEERSNERIRGEEPKLNEESERSVEQCYREIKNEEETREFEQMDEQVGLEKVKIGAELKSNNRGELKDVSLKVGNEEDKIFGSEDNGKKDAFVDSRNKYVLQETREVVGLEGENKAELEDCKTSAGLEEKSNRFVIGAESVKSEEKEKSFRLLGEESGPVGHKEVKENDDIVEFTNQEEDTDGAKGDLFEKKNTRGNPVPEQDCWMLDGEKNKEDKLEKEEKKTKMEERISKSSEEWEKVENVNEAELSSASNDCPVTVVIKQQAETETVLSMHKEHKLQETPTLSNVGREGNSQGCDGDAGISERAADESRETGYSQAGDEGVQTGCAQAMTGELNIQMDTRVTVTEEGAEGIVTETAGSDSLDTAKGFAKVDPPLCVTDRQNERDGRSEEETEEPTAHRSHTVENPEEMMMQILKEISTHVSEKDLQIQPLLGDYSGFTEMQTDQGRFGHIIEVYGFSSKLRTEDLMAPFEEYRERGFRLEWVDQTHALGIFSSPEDAFAASCQAHPSMKFRPLSQGSRQSKLRAQERAEFFQPYKDRPQMDTAVARRLVNRALGLQKQQEKPVTEE